MNPIIGEVHTLLWIGLVRMTLSNTHIRSILLVGGVVAIVAAPILWGDSRQAATVEPFTFQRGVALAHVHRDDRGYGSDACRATLMHLRSLGVEWVSLTPFIYQRRVDVPEMSFNRDDISRDLLKRAIQDAHDLQMRVLLKPHIWSRDFGRNNKWGGDIAFAREEDWQRWFDAYRAGMVQYARFAESTGVELLCVGLEYVQASTGYPEEWRRIIAEIREVYSGELTYGGNGVGEFDRITFWDALDYIGVQAYFPLASEPGATIAELKAGWRPHVDKIARVQKKYGKPVLFTEAGYRAVAGAAVQPWHWGSRDDIVSLEEQRRCYQALCETFDDIPWFAGIYWWKWYSAPRQSGRRGSGWMERDFAPTGKPAEKVMQQFFHLWEGRTGGV